MRPLIKYCQPHTSNTAEDPFRCSLQSLRTTRGRSETLWRELGRRTSAARQFPSACRNVDGILHNTPGMPGEENVYEHAGDELVLQGVSIWDLGASTCTELRKKHSRPLGITIGVSKPSVCEISNEAAPKPWSRFGPRPSTPAKNNFIAILTLGWCYVLSARLLEIRRNGNAQNVEYERKGTSLSCRPQDGDCFVVNIGTADKAELCWWKTILADRPAWFAKLHGEAPRKDMPKCYHSPWQCHLVGSKSFSVQSVECASVERASSHPPSSRNAYNYLRRFADLHDANDQLEAALISALTVPAHMRHGAPVVLPTPLNMTDISRTASQFGESAPDLFQRIPHLMTLTCFPPAIPSAIFSCVWESGIDCNIVDQWVEPGIANVRALLKSGKQEALVSMLTERRPRLGPLIFSAVMTQLLPRLVDILSSHIPAMSLESSVWTRSPQSFMDPALCRPRPLSWSRGLPESISRADELRLLFITDEDSTRYGPPPMSPYPPAGSVSLCECTLAVQNHVQCYHSLLYDAWGWLSYEGKTVVIDSGTSCTYDAEDEVETGYLQSICSVGYTTKDETRLRVEQLSGKATRNVWSWAFFRDGSRHGDEVCWQHPWLESILLARDADDDADGDIKSK